MPALPSVPNVLRFNFTQGRDADLLIGTRLFFKYTGGPPTTTDCTAFASGAVAAYVAHLLSFLSDNGVLDSVECIDLSSSSGATGTATSGAVGTRSGSVVPESAAALVTHTISRRYRGGKPKSFWPFFTDSDLVSATNWNSSAVSALTTAYAAFQAALLALSSGGVAISQAVNVSYYGPPNRIITGSTGRVRTVSTVRTTPLVDNIVASTARALIGSQRRRLTA